VAGIAAQRENPGVDERVERLDAPAQDLRETGELLDALDLDAVLPQERFRAAGRIQLDTQVGEPTGKIDHTGLVEHADQRAHLILGHRRPDRLQCILSRGL
jgi:hypothetical protein